jgi:hypothetical protein
VRLIQLSQQCPGFRKRRLTTFKKRFDFSCHCAIRKKTYYYDFQKFITPTFWGEESVFHSPSIADEAYVLENGSVALEGQAKELLENPQVKGAYLGI